MKVKIVDVKQSVDPFNACAVVHFDWDNQQSLVIIRPGENLASRIRERLADLEEFDRQLAKLAPLLLELEGLKGTEIEI